MFFCYVLGTKLGAVLPLRMRHKLCILWFAGSLKTKVKNLNFIKVSIKVPIEDSILFQIKSRVSELTGVRLFWCSLATFWAQN